MRQLRGKTKETRKEKQDRRRENREIKSQFSTIVLPSLIIAAVFIILYVYAKTRPM